mgnify:CR=1 FL=1
MALGRKTGGRQKNTPNKASRKREAEVAATGTTPLEYLLSDMRDDTLERSDRRTAAIAAAPYVHPRLSNIEAQLNGELRVTEIRETYRDPRS